MENEPKALFEIKDQIAVFTLNNPPQNRLVAEVYLALNAALDQIAASDARVLIIQANGNDFSYGGYFPSWIDKKPAELKPVFTAGLAINNRLEALPIPVIASVHGACWGGAFELALRCDIIIATPEATFNHPEKTLGVTTLMGGVYRFAERATRNIAAELAYTSEPLGAERLYQLGTVNRLVPREKLEEECMRLAKDIAIGPPRAHTAHKSLLNAWSAGGIAAADQVLLDLSAVLFDMNDVDMALKSAKEALESGQKRPKLQFNGN